MIGMDLQAAHMLPGVAMAGTGATGSSLTMLNGQ